MNFERLSAGLRAITYPEQLRFIDRGIRGHGFYPGAMQCMFGEQSTPRIMLLGRDFGTVEYYSKLHATPRSEYALTWRRTRDLYLREFSGAYVFCTNYLMGLRVDGSAKGDIRNRLSSEVWTEYERHCWQFLLSQIAEFRPDAILVFGSDNRRDLNKENRLGSLSISCFYGPHPHSAIGTANAAQHLATCGQIKAHLALACA
jgi:hypothetical protein